MALDGIIISKIKKEIENFLPIKINKIFESSKTEIIMHTYAKNNKKTIIISLNPNYNRISFTNKSYTDFNEPSNFIMVLRKYLTNGIIESIDQFYYDRFLIFHITSFNNIYDKVEYLLSIELLGKYTNLILIDKKTNKIIDAYKKISTYENSKRTVLIGANFIPIINQKKNNPFETSIYDINKSFVEQFQGFSKLLEKEIRFRLQNETFENIMQYINDSEYLYVTNNEYHVLPLTHLQNNYQRFSISEGLDYIYHQISENERIKNYTNNILKFVNKQIKHNTNKLDKLNQDIFNSQNYQLDKDIADAIFTQENLEIKGISKISLKLLNNKIINIDLDKKISLKENANKFYKKYSKKKKSIDYINQEISKCLNEIEYFKGLLEQLEIASYQDGIEIKNELIKYGYINSKVKSNTIKHKTKLKQIKYNNYLITWGSNNIENDYLTFSYANKNSTFFHAQDYHGSHVIVDSITLNEEVIRMAANIAAYYSKGRFSSSVPVNYCHIKDVKKIKGKKAGYVSIKNQKTIYIDPETITLPIYTI